MKVFGAEIKEDSQMWRLKCGLQEEGVFLGACGKLLIFDGMQLEVEKLVWLFLLLLFKLSYVPSAGNFMIFTWGDLELLSVEQNRVL